MPPKPLKKKIANPSNYKEAMHNFRIDKKQIQMATPGLHYGTGWLLDKPKRSDFGTRGERKRAEERAKNRRPANPRFL